MNFVFSDEQEDLRHLARRLLDDLSPVGEARRLMASPGAHDPHLWAVMAAEVGLTGIAVPAAYGGAGRGHAELGLVFEEMGAHLLTSPFFSTVGLAVNALVASGDDQACADLLPGMVEGRTTATVALWEDAGIRDEPAATAVPGAVPGEWLLTGSKSYVTDGATADVLLLTAHTPAGTSLFSVGAGAPGLARRPLSTLDLTRPLCRLELSGTPGRLVGTEGGGGQVLERTLALATVALAAEEVGGAQACLDQVVAYAGRRIQFGRPIGSFQAVQHACADTLVALESARSATYYAAWAADQAGTVPVPGPADDELHVAAATAQLAAAGAYQRAAADHVHFHGALGFTWDHDAHLYFKRAKSSALLLGEPAWHRRRLADRLGL